MSSVSPPLRFRSSVAIGLYTASAFALTLAPEPPDDDVTVSSHIPVSLPPPPAADNVTAAAPPPLTAQNPPFAAETCAVACETLDSSAGVSLESTTVVSLTALLELDGPGSIFPLGLEK